jgi:hypothetical protein
MFMLFIVIVAAILTALVIWQDPARVYQIANRIVGLLLAAGVIYMIVQKVM